MLVQDTAKNVGGVFYETQCRITEMVGCQKTKCSSSWPPIITFICIVNIQTFIPTFTQTHSIPKAYSKNNTLPLCPARLVLCRLISHPIRRDFNPPAPLWIIPTHLMGHFNAIRELYSTTTVDA